MNETGKNPKAFFFFPCVAPPHNIAGLTRLSLNPPTPPPARSTCYSNQLAHGTAGRPVSSITHGTLFRVEIKDSWLGVSPWRATSDWANEPWRGRGKLFEETLTCVASRCPSWARPQLWRRSSRQSGEAICAHFPFGRRLPPPPLTKDTRFVRCPHLLLMHPNVLISCSEKSRRLSTHWSMYWSNVLNEQCTQYSVPLFLSHWMLWKLH